MTIKNGDMPVNSNSVQNVYDAFSQSPTGWEKASLGLTKREHFAAMAMQGILGNDKRVCCTSIVVHQAVEMADALLKELEK